MKYKKTSLCLELIYYKDNNNSIFYPIKKKDFTNVSCKPLLMWDILLYSVNMLLLLVDE